MTSVAIGNTVATGAASFTGDIFGVYYDTGSWDLNAIKLHACLGTKYWTAGTPNTCTSCPTACTDCTSATACTACNGADSA